MSDASPPDCAGTVSPARRPDFARRLLCAGAALLMLGLGGCAASHVSDVSTAAMTEAPPGEILVLVDAAPTGATQDASKIEPVAGALQADLVRRLTKAGIVAVPYTFGAAEPGAAVLHVSIVAADPGSAAERFLVGFGFGRARLNTHVVLNTGQPLDDTSLVAFDTTSNSGIKPGLILPGGVALATRNAVHLAIGGAIDVAVNLRGGLQRPIARTAGAVVHQLRRYYASAGWGWPAAET